MLCWLDLFLKLYIFYTFLNDHFEIMFSNYLLLVSVYVYKIISALNTLTRYIFNLKVLMLIMMGIHKSSGLFNLRT